MIAAPPPAKVETKRRKADAPVGLVRVYVAGDGRHHWSLNRVLTLCGMVTSKDDVTKPGDVQCIACRDLVEEQP